MKLLRQYLISDTDLIHLLDNSPAIYLLDKPMEINNDNYIVYLYKPLTGGYVKDYQIEFRIIGKDLEKLTAIQSRLIKLLDDPRNENIIKSQDTFIRHTKLLNGGGMAINPSTGNYEIVIFFLIKI
jgi:hypothetical protein